MSTLNRNIVDDIASLIRFSVDDLPGIESMMNNYPEIHHNDVHIFNEMWKCNGLRKIHLETGQAKGLEVLHCVWFPDPSYNLPIFGADIVATPTVVTAAIVDISPVSGTDWIYEEIGKVSELYHFKEPRELPEWADIFSDHMKFQRIRDEIEVANFYCIVLEYLRIYKEAVRNSKQDSPCSVLTGERFDDQTRYCKQQKKNRKTSSVLSKWFDKGWAEDYIDSILFDEP